MHSNADRTPCGTPPRDNPEGWLAFLEAWHDRFGDRIVDLDKLVDLFRAASTQFDALASTHRGYRTILNRSLYGARSRLYEPFLIETFTPAGNGSLAYRLRRLVPLTDWKADRRD
jgi:hypothetical protein